MAELGSGLRSAACPVCGDGNGGSVTLLCCKPKPLITLVLPFYNEAGYIEHTIDSIARQSDRRFRLVLVDNGSQDDGAERAASRCDALRDIDVRFVTESTPGKIHALANGTARIETPYLATLDADTLYPPDYVATCIRLFRANPDAAAVMSVGLSSSHGPKGRLWRIFRTMLMSRLFGAKCHTGAYAQAFRTDAFRAAGGYDPTIWNYVLEDHEIVYRVGRHGPTVYHRDHCCITSDRRSDRTHVSWSWFEKLLYTFTPQALMDWYFYRFLIRRFEARRLFNMRLRTVAPRPIQANEDRALVA